MFSIIFGIFLIVFLFACWYIIDKIAGKHREIVSILVLIILAGIFFGTVLD